MAANGIADAVVSGQAPARSVVFLMPIPKLSAKIEVHRWKQSRTSPVAFMCDDGNVYAFKPPIYPKENVTDHVAARVASVIGAPVPPCACGIVPDEMMSGDPIIERYRGKLSHATLRIPNVADVKNVALCHPDLNRSRLAKLQVLYSLLHADDRQLLVGVSAPHEVWSVDHGLFLPGGQNWSASSLAAQASNVSLDPWFAAAALSVADLKAAGASLQHLTDTLVAQVISEIPKEWTTDVPTAWSSVQKDMEGLRGFITQRRDKLSELLQKS